MTYQDDLRRWRPSNRKPSPGDPPALRVTDALGAEGGTASIYIYDAIDAWGEEWGVSASEFIAALQGVQASRIDLHLNSPGGDLLEAIAMRAALARHPAAITVYIDGLAASAASVLATVGERVIASPGSQVMVHCASTFSIGNAEDMRATAALLDKADQDIAGFYAHRAGGTVDQWLAAMKTETWYSAEEAVAAGLVDEVEAMGPTRAEPQLLVASANRWILATYRYAGRDKAPEPSVTAAADVIHFDAPAPVEPVESEAPAVEASPPAEPAPLTSPLLDDEAVARIAEAVAERLAQRATPEPTPEAVPDEAAPTETPAAVAAVAPPPAPLPAPTAGAPTPQLPAAWDPHLIRNAIRKAAAT